MRPIIAFVIFLVMVLSMSTPATAEGPPPDSRLIASPTGLPCVLAMVDGHLFPSGNSVSVSATHTRIANCHGAVIFDDQRVLYDALWLTLQRWSVTTGEWQTVVGQPFRLAMALDNRRQVASFSDLGDGRYRLLLVSGTEPGPWYFLDAVHFVVGGTGEDQLRVTLGLAPRFDPEGRTPSIKSARQAYNGKLYFGGTLPVGYATGFIYQVRADRTEVLPVQFRQAGSRIVVELPNNSFDGTRPVYASVTADGGGLTIQGVVFDPTDPEALFLGFNVPR